MSLIDVYEFTIEYLWDKFHVKPNFLEQSMNYYIIRWDNQEISVFFLADNYVMRYNKLINGQVLKEMFFINNIPNLYKQTKLLIDHISPNKVF